MEPGLGSATRALARPACAAATRPRSRVVVCALAAAGALLLVLLSALVRPTTAAADPIDLQATTRPPEETSSPASLAPDQSALATPSETATDDPTDPPTDPPAETTAPPPEETVSQTPSPTGDSSPTPSGVETSPGSQPPTESGTSEPSATSEGSSSSGGTTTPPPGTTGSGSAGTGGTSGGTATPPVPEPEPEPEPAPATKNMKWAEALFLKSTTPVEDPTSLAPTINTVPVVTARAVCGGIVFANPDNAFPAAVAYGKFSDAPSKPLTLKPTETRFVPYTKKSIDWAARSQDPASGASTEVVGAAGFGKAVKVPQFGSDCDDPPTAIHAVALAPCLARGQDAVIMVDDNRKTAADTELSWRISRKGDQLVLAQGVLGRTGVSSVDLSSFGVGTYSVSVLESGKVEDAVDFEALDCVATSVTCDEVTVTNPIRNPVPVTVTWRTDTAGGAKAKKAKVITLAPGVGFPVPAVAGSLQWSAISTRPSTALGSLIGDAGSDRSAISERCASPSTSSAPTGSAAADETSDQTSATAVDRGGSGQADPSSAVSSDDGPGPNVPGPGATGSAALLVGIALGGAALVWLLAVLLRRRL